MVELYEISSTFVNHVEKAWLITKVNLVIDLFEYFILNFVGDNIDSLGSNFQLCKSPS